MHACSFLVRDLLFEPGMNAHRDAAPTLWEEFVPAGAHWSGLVRRGRILRITDLVGGANVPALFYSHANPLERYNMADTLKAQHTAFLTSGHVCYSDMGRILCSIVADTCGWHDTYCGLSNADSVRERHGVARYQEHRNGYYRNGYDSMLNELGKFGLGRRDIVANINFFSKVTADEGGSLKFHAGHSRPGAHVDLRFEMDTIVVLATSQHPLDPDPHYRPRDIQLSLHTAAPVAADDVCRTSCAENIRGFINTERMYL